MHGQDQLQIDSAPALRDVDEDLSLVQLRTTVSSRSVQTNLDQIVHDIESRYRRVYIFLRFTHLLFLYSAYYNQSHIKRLFISSILTLCTQPTKISLSLEASYTLPKLRAILSTSMHPLSYLLAVSTGLTLVSAQTIQEAVTGYTLLGCYTDSAASRGLTGNYDQVATNNDATWCASYCDGTTYFGLEFGKNKPDDNLCPGSR